VVEFHCCQRNYFLARSGYFQRSFARKICHPAKFSDLATCTTVIKLQKQLQFATAKIQLFWIIFNIEDRIF